jgi:hypothetical protein
MQWFNDFPGADTKKYLEKLQKVTYSRLFS